MFITFIIAVVSLVLVLSLQKRVNKLEESLKSSQSVKKEEDVFDVGSSKVVDISSIPDELVSYIKDQFDVGVPEKDICNSLLSSGWDSAVIENAVVHIKNERDKQKEGIGVIVSGDSGVTWGKTFTKWLMEDWLMKVGAFLLLIGFGWFVSYAFMNDWIGERARIFLGLLVGALVMVLGEWRIREFKNQGAVLLSLGASIVLLTTFAGREIYGFFTPVSALGIMLLAIAFTALSSVRHNSRSLATLAVVLSGVAPLLTSAKPEVLELFTYLLIVSIGVLWVTALTGWRFLAPISVSIVILYTLAPFSGLMDLDKNAMFIVSSLFSVLYFIANMTSVIKTKKVTPHDVYTAAASAFLAVLWIMISISEEWRSLVTAGWAVLFAGASFAVFRITSRSDFSIIYYTIAIAMIGIATAMELNGAVLALAYIFEISLMSISAWFVLGNTKIAQDISVLLVVPAVLSIESFVSSSWRTGVLHSDFFVLFFMFVALCSLGYFFYLNRHVEHNPPSVDKITLSIVIGALYALGLIWLSLHAYFQDGDTATMVSLVVYTTIGMFAYIKGKMADSKALLVSGGVLLGFVVARLLLIEIWNMELIGRITIFILIGVLLISTAFIGRSKD